MVKPGLVACMTVVAAIFGTGALADTIFEVEHARASARTGLPVNAADAEFLSRWGALSGSPASGKRRAKKTWLRATAAPKSR